MICKNNDSDDNNNDNNNSNNNDNNIIDINNNSNKNNDDYITYIYICTYASPDLIILPLVLVRHSRNQHLDVF